LITVKIRNANRFYISREMRHRETTEVLVVGAGPVGMVAALALAQRGVHVQIIDREPCPATHSYACALHAPTVRLLEQFGLAEEVLNLGRLIKAIIFYDRHIRWASVRYIELPGPHPFLVVLPQSALERLLERQLKATSHVQIRWNHRLSNLQQTNSGASATVEKLVQTVKGYGVPELDWVVDKEIETDASFIVGADGQLSFVRRHGNFDDQQIGDPMRFAVYEFELESPLPDEAVVVLDGQNSSALFPLLGMRARWTFQIPAEGTSEEFPDKDRTYEIAERPSATEAVQAELKRLIRARAPWFTQEIKEVHWHTEVEFHRRLAKHFCQGRLVLAGDAAHQTNPESFQSMNAGMREAVDVAELLKRFSENTPQSIRCRTSGTHCIMTAKRSSPRL
jgi:2-polyprenyl-6-methoxyphenol hydroxylase-like FAD-dependent oxidoreductase